MPDDAPLHTPKASVPGASRFEAEQSPYDRYPYSRNERYFIEQVDVFRSIKKFLFNEGVSVKEKDLQTLSKASYLTSMTLDLAAPPPSADDWTNLENAVFALYAYLEDEKLRTRYRLNFATALLFSLPLWFVAGACVALGIVNVVGIYHYSESAPGQIWGLVAFILWLLCLGGIGAVAYIYVNALSIQNDPTVDVSNRGFVWGRVIIGCLFALVLSLAIPWQQPQLQQQNPGELLRFATGGSGTGNLTHSALLITPFLLGFSTNLVLLILRKLIESAQTLFGIQGK